MKDPHSTVLLCPGLALTGRESTERLKSKEEGVREGLGVERHTGLGIYGWQWVRVHVFGPFVGQWVCVYTSQYSY